MISDRERFLAAVYTGPLLRADAIVVLCGEDAAERANAAAELFRQGAAERIICTGGLHDGVRCVDAEHVSGLLMGAHAISPDRITVEFASLNTHEQAEHVIEMAVTNEWKSLLLVASAYHLPRAVLTFIESIGGRDIRVVGVPAAQLSWFTPPPGMTQTRLELLGVDLAKVEEYAEHCATWTEGLDHLKRWDK